MAGFEEAIARANAAIDAGADMAFVEAPQTMEEITAVPKRVKGPCLLNVVWGGKTPQIDLREAEALGFKLAIVPGLLLKAAIGACDAALAALKETHIHPAPRDGMTVRAAFDRVGATEWDAFRTKFRAPEAKRAAE
jgi:2-methylisocitrate lyase-like PEP mutase family enzyme